MDKTSNSFAKRLKELMQEKNVNSLDIESATKISNQAISLWLHEKREPKLYYLWVLADYFECSIDYLVGREKD